jgi:hypothetical protein
MPDLQISGWEACLNQRLDLLRLREQGRSAGWHQSFSALRSSSSERRRQTYTLTAVYVSRFVVVYFYRGPLADLMSALYLLKTIC